MIEVEHFEDTIDGGSLCRRQATANDEHDRCVLEHVVESKSLHIIDALGDNFIWHLTLHLPASCLQPRIPKALNRRGPLAQFDLHQRADEFLALK